MSDKPMNKREREYMRPAIVHRWEIHQAAYRTTALWDEDTIMPVKVGKMAESLIERGYLEKVSMGFGGYKLRATDKAEKLHCYRCYCGRTHDENGKESGRCSHCDGHGMLQERAA